MSKFLLNAWCLLFAVWKENAAASVSTQVTILLCFVKGNNKGEYIDDNDDVDVDGSNGVAGGNDVISLIVLLFNSQSQNQGCGVRV